jgi:cyclic pyranopterin phosphate synthase
LVTKLVQIPGITDVALTTNGILLADQAPALRKAGLHRINISLDAMSEATFQRISRREGLDRVFAGIFAAKEAGFPRIRLNAVAIRGVTESEIVPLGEFAREHDFELRFIEFMPLDAEGNWQSDQVLGMKYASNWRTLSVLWKPSTVPIPVSRPSTSVSSTVAAASGLLTRSPIRFAVTAIACVSLPKEKSATVCSRR